jgi:3-oxoacyl-[acyl-carrier-protein] synthase-1
MSEPVVIVALGASTSIGRDAWASAAAVRAGVNHFGQHPFMIDTAGEPMRVARADWLGIDVSGVDRFEALLFPAIEQAIEPLMAHAGSVPTVALALGLPAPRPGVPDSLQGELMKRIARHFAKRFGAAAAFASGHAAGLMALEAGLRKLQQGGLDACVVAGVDSYIDADALEWLESCDQLHSAGPLNNAWGFIPGEAAGALLLMRADAAERIGAKPLATVLGAASAVEAKRIKTETVCLGEGLTEAFRAALQSLPGGALVSDVYCDMNGEPYRADEYGFTALRTKEAFVSPSEFVAPADCWGDVAAASGPLQVMLSTIAGAKGYARGPLAFAWASAEGGERAAAVVATRRAE